MKKSYFVYLLSTFGIIALVIIFAGGGFLHFIDPVSLMLVYIPTMFMLLSNYSPSEILNAFKLAM